MKSLKMLAVFIFMVNIINAENEDLIKPADVESPELQELSDTLTHLENISVSNKTKKFVVTLKPLVKTPFVLPKRGEKKPFVPKFQLKNDYKKENIQTFPTSSTKRPQVMQTKKFTSKPHVVDRTEELMERNNFYNKRTPSKFNRFENEENAKDTEKNQHEGKAVENIESRFQNFTDIDISSENSDESKEIRKPITRRFMKAAASRRVTHKVKTTLQATSPPITTTTTQRNYKIKDLLKNQRYIPRVERKKMPALSVQNDDGPARNNANVPVEVDHKKSAFIRRKPSTMSPDENKTEATEAVEESISRQERSVNIIEEERVLTTSGTKFTAKDWPMSPEFTYRNIHS